jgi:hypothetical protein
MSTRKGLNCRLSADPLDRDRPFRYIHAQRAWHAQAGQPTVSVDTKKKERVGHFKKAGPIGGQQPERVNDPDFPGDAEGRAVP